MPMTDLSCNCNTTTMAHANTHQQTLAALNLNPKRPLNSKTMFAKIENDKAPFIPSKDERDALKELFKTLSKDPSTTIQEATPTPIKKINEPK